MSSSCFQPSSCDNNLFLDAVFMYGLNTHSDSAVSALSRVPSFKSYSFNWNLGPTSVNSISFSAT